MRLVLLGIWLNLQFCQLFGQTAVGGFIANEIGNDGKLCFEESCVIQPLTGQIMPQNVNDPTLTFNPGIGLAVFSCIPTYNNNDLLSDPCLINILYAQPFNLVYDPFIIQNSNNFWNSLPAPFNNSPTTTTTLYFQMITLYDVVNLVPYSALSAPNFDFNSSNYFSLDFAPTVNIALNELCQLGQIEMNVTEGSPLNSTDFTLINTFPSSATFPSVIINGISTTINNLQNGDYVGMQIVSANNCIYDVNPILFQGVVTAQITAPLQFCENDQTHIFTATPAGGVWSGTPAIDNITGEFDPGFFNITNQTNYTIQYTPTNGAPGCNIAENITITVLPTIESTIIAPNSFCINDEIYAFSSINNNGIWSGPFNCMSPNGLFNPSIAQVGTHTIVHAIPGLCGSTSTQDVVVHGLPVIQFNASVTEGCLPLEIEFTDNTAPNTYDHRWFVNQSPVIGFDPTFQYTFENAQCYDIGLALTDNFGCRDTLDSLQLICPFADPWIDFEMLPLNPTIDQPVVYFSNNNSGLVSFDWDFAGEANGSGDISYHSFESVVPGEFQVCLTAIDTNGCDNTGCQFIPLVSAFNVFAATAFTPGTDGVNDAFKPVIVSPREVKSYEFQIFDKWGSMVFSTDDPEKYWYGNNDGGEHYVQDDLFNWRLGITLYGLEDKQIFTGTVLIIR